MSAFRVHLIKAKYTGNGRRLSAADTAYKPAQNRAKSLYSTTISRIFGRCQADRPSFFMVHKQKQVLRLQALRFWYHEKIIKPRQKALFTGRLLSFRYAFNK